MVKLFVLLALRRAILSSMPQRSVIGSTPFASQSGEIGNYCFFCDALGCFKCSQCVASQTTVYTRKHLSANYVNRLFISEFYIMAVPVCPCQRLTFCLLIAFILSDDVTCCYPTSYNYNCYEKM